MPRRTRPAGALARTARLLTLALLALSPARAAEPPAPAPASASAPRPAPFMGPEVRLGNPRARVTLVEYASDTCPHCARFGLEVFPAFRKAYVDTGKVLYVFREFPTPPEDLSAAGFLIARCAGEAKYLAVVDALFAAQPTAKTGLDFLLAGGRAGGLDEAAVKACLDDKAAVAALEARVKTAAETEKIESTPTFIVNGRRLPEGEKSLADLRAAVDPLLAARRRP